MKAHIRGILFHSRGCQNSQNCLLGEPEQNCNFSTNSKCHPDSGIEYASQPSSNDANLENPRESAGLGILAVHSPPPPLFEFYSSSLSVCNVELGGGTKW